MNHTFNNPLTETKTNNHLPLLIGDVRQFLNLVVCAAGLHRFPKKIKSTSLIQIADSLQQNLINSCTSFLSTNTYFGMVCVF